ncbi:unnamed protein product [Auanema sp. JU1783]|nr:unnamed protein product [Auanema sp. JU1783]
MPTDTSKTVNLPRWRKRGRLSEAALSCRVKILKVVTMVRVVNRWRQMAANITYGAASIVSLIASSSSSLATIHHHHHHNSAQLQLHLHQNHHRSHSPHPPQSPQPPTSPIASSGFQLKRM